MFQTRELCPFRAEKPSMVCRYRGFCGLKDLGFTKQIEFYCYLSRITGFPIGESISRDSAPDPKKLKKVEMLAEVFRWFDDPVLLEDYQRGNFMSTGKISMSTRKCRLWRRAYRHYLKWKEERRLDWLQQEPMS